MECLQTQGISLPRLGLGTFRMQGDGCRAAVESALGLGYRHIDTAEMYGNEEAIGAAIAASRLPRGDLHVTTKVWNENLAPDAIRRAFDASLKKLRLDHIDLYLVHWPSRNMNLPAVFETLLKLKAEGRTRAIGVANFNVALLKTVVEEIKAPIACYQVEYHVMLDQTKLRKYLAAKSIPLVAYCPLAQGQGGVRRDADGDRPQARRQRRPGGAEMAARPGRCRRDPEGVARRKPEGQSRRAACRARRRGHEGDRGAAERRALRESRFCAGVGLGHAGLRRHVRRRKRSCRPAPAQPRGFPWVQPQKTKMQAPVHAQKEWPLAGPFSFLGRASVSVTTMLDDHDLVGVAMTPAFVESAIAMFAEFGARAEIMMMATALDHHRFSAGNRRRGDRDRAKRGQNASKLLHCCPPRLSKH